MSNGNALQVQNGAVAVQSAPMGVTEIKEQVNLIQHVMKEVMKSGEHYGTIPGCGTKPALLKAGAEKLSLTFRFSPKFEINIQDLGNGHRNFDVRCILSRIITGNFICEGVGSCSTMESKYRYRKAEQICPECGANTIIRGKKEYGGGWLCYQKKGGCGAKFTDGDPIIENQEMGRVEHDNPADYWNTCLKMGKKRAHVDAILTATAASDIFTQDIDDDPGLYGGKEVKQTPSESPRTNEPPPDDYYGGESEPQEDPENQKRQDIINWCMTITAGNAKEAKNILVKATSFIGKDKKEVPGASEPSKLTGKRLEIAHAKIHKMFDEFTEKDTSPVADTKPAGDPELPF